MAAMGPSIPEFTLSNTADSGLVIRITNTNAVINTYRVSVRRKVGNYNLDRLYSFTNTTTFIIPEVKKDTSYYVSVAATDSNGVESIFTVEQQAKALGSTLNSVYSKGNTIQFDIVPNPTKGEMTVNLSGLQNTPKVEIYITDIQGKVVSKSTLNTLNGNATQHFENNQLVAGIYQCSVVAKGIVLSTKSLIIEK